MHGKSMRRAALGYRLDGFNGKDATRHQRVDVPLHALPPDALMQLTKTLSVPVSPPMPILYVVRTFLSLGAFRAVMATR
jgi:hypothetical protein